MLVAHHAYAQVRGCVVQHNEIDAASQSPFEVALESQARTIEARLRRLLEQHCHIDIARWPVSSTCDRPEQVDRDDARLCAAHVDDLLFEAKGHEPIIAPASAATAGAAGRMGGAYT